MRTKPLTADDRELITIGEDLLRKHYEPGRHRCSAVLRSESGDIYTGMNLITGGQADVHSEPVALGNAVLADDLPIETSVAIIYENYDDSNPMRVVSACGICRELYHEISPEVDIVIRGDDGPVKAPLSELLPAKS